ncbi:MFS transporter [Massilia sp. CCM 9210]|uniref:MFS transporter n=1 Tax=Massilia scottii TaxID=3057166 RepID=UPI0027964195|nr:MFS transporter [Massilia sp. CCM 9210]MDQ1811990.1 MFS transporter [Massilia sp. CCM 9210]
MAASVSPRPAAQRRWTLAALSLSMLLSSLGTSIANVGLPTLAQAFGATFAQVQWVVLAYLLAITTVIVGAGRLGDLAGRRRLLLAGIALFTAASALCGMATALPWLIAARALQGLGAAVMMALTMSFVTEAAPKDGTGSVMGLLGTMSAIGTALGPSLGGLLIAAVGWRALFLINVPLGMLTLLLAYRALPGDVRRPAVFDHVGTFLLAVTLGAYALAMTAGGGRFGAVNLGLLLAAAAGTGLFMLAESRAASPLIPLALLRDRLLGARLGTTTLVSTVMMATLIVGPFYLARALALAPAAVGMVLSAGPLVSALCGMPAGRIVDRAGTPGVTIAGLMLMLAGTLPLAVLPASVGVPGYLGPLIVITIGYALFQAANNTALMADAGADQRGVVSGMLNLARNLGLVTGASLMGAVFAFGSAAATTAPDAAAAGMHRTFALAAVLLAAALAIAWRAGRAQKQQA